MKKNNWTSENLFFKDDQTSILNLLKKPKVAKKIVKKSVPKISNEALIYKFESELENIYADYVKEHLPVPNRKFRLDYAVPCVKIGFEIHGGQYQIRKGRNGALIIGGRHNSGAGYENDLMKMNLCTMHGWEVFQFTYQQLAAGEYLPFFEYLEKQLLDRSLNIVKNQ
jgi:hypothetical protein